ncbi:hypothetical protein RhiJN_08675 [Ceratobasidium sp. AG-Ba]|nr:hypothetical protein RhiJN_08675 [Ceratobasidium sp. AG-Ba]
MPVEGLPIPPKVRLSRDVKGENEPIFVREWDEEFNYHFGNICLRVQDLNFRIHSYKLENFNDIVKKLPQESTIETVVELTGEIDDVRRTLRILPETSGEGSFDVLTWRSGLWMATEFNNPTLRTRCIRNLEKENLSVDEYLWFCREFDIADWVDKIVDLLSARSTALIIDEIKNMGADLSAVVMAKREGRPKEETQRLRDEIEMLRPTKRLRTRKSE